MATKSRLSTKGLDKIFGDGINDVIRDIEHDEGLKETASTIQISTIKPNPHQPRRFFDDSELQDLAASIKQYGIIQPIVVTPTINGYHIVAGERRTRAAKLAGLKEIPAIVVNFDDQQMQEVALIENIQRVDLTPIEEAIAYRDLIALLQLTQEALATRVGKSRSHIANTMRLLSLPKKVQDMILNHSLSMGQVKPLITLNDQQLIAELADRIVQQRLNARQVEDLVKKMTAKPAVKVENKTAKNHREVTEFLENRIMHRLGTKVSIEDHKLVINYSTIKDLNRILDLLGLIENE